MKNLIEEKGYHPTFVMLVTQVVDVEYLYIIGHCMGYKNEQGYKPVIPLRQQQVSGDSVNKAMKEQKQDAMDTPTILSAVDTIKLKKEIGNKVSCEETEEQVYHGNRELTMFSNLVINGRIKGTLAV